MASRLERRAGATAMSPAAEVKAATRQVLRQLVQAMTASERALASDGVRRLLSAQPFWRNAASLLAFVPTADEPDIWPCVQAAQAAGCRIHLPRFSPDAKAYEVRQVRDLVTELAPGPYGIREPGPGCPVWDGKPLDLILVPGIGFDASGARLGRGKGYFDRLLARMPGCKCGVAFEPQLISELPMEPHDVRLDFVITPSRCVATSISGSGPVRSD